MNAAAKEFTLVNNVFLSYIIAFEHSLMHNASSMLIASCCSAIDEVIKCYIDEVKFHSYACT